MRRIFLVILLIIQQSLSAQNEQMKDSLISLVNTSRSFYEAGQLDRSYSYAKTAYNLAKQLKADFLQVRIVGTLSFLEPDLEKAIAYLAESEPIAIRNQQWKYLENIYHVRASNYFHRNDDQNALIHFLKLDSLLEKRDNNQHLAAMTKVSIINVLHGSRSVNDTSYFPQMNRLIKEGLKISDSLDFDVPAAILLEKKAYVYTQRKQPQNAITYYQKALNKTKANNNHLRKGIIYNGIANIYESTNRQDSALLYYEKQLKAINQTVDTVQIAIANYKVAKYYNKISKPKIALEYLNKSQNLFQEGHYIREEEQYNIQEILADIHYNLGDYKRAYEASQEAQRQLKVIQSNTNKENVKELETKYQTDKKEQEISLLKSQSQLAEQQRKNQQTLLLGGLSITSIAGFFLFMLYRNRKKTADKLKQLDNTKSKFFTNISHEFRTPLTLITNPIDEMLEDDSISEKQRQKFSMAKRNSNRLLSLVNQLLDLSKIDAGKLKLHVQKGNLKQLIGALSDSFTYNANLKGIHYSVVIDHQDALDTYFDKDAIEKIVVNLISNAIKYTPENESASFSAEVSNNTLTLEVKNTGVGLTKKELNNIFERFYQTSEDNIGTGIGLALVKELVDLHKGQLIVDSSPSAWTSFKILLPVDKHSFNKKQLVNGAALNSSMERILIPNQDIAKQEDKSLSENDQPVLLIVEDNLDVRILLKRTFEDNYNIILAANGEEGVTLAIEQVPDIIISDIMMPKKDGIELTQELKHDVRTSHIPIVLLTAKAGENNELKGIETGADDYLTKPFSSKILVAKISKLLEVREKLQKRYSQEIVLKPKDITMSTIDEEFLEKVQTILDEQLVESSFNIEAFCKGVGMSRMQLHRKIKAFTGLSTSEFIRSQRLKLAAELLKKTDVNVSEIGYAVGFNDRSYFTKCFRETFGSAPTSYAKKIR